MEQKSKDTFYLDPDYENFVPRKTRLKYKTVGIGIPATLFFLVIGTLGAFFAWVFISMAYEGLRDYWRFEIKGLETQATVTACELVRQSEKANRLRVTYDYSVGGVEYSAYDAVVKVHAHCREFPPETQIDIEYNKANPHYSRIVDTNWIIFICLTPIIVCAIPMFLYIFAFGIYVAMLEIYARYKYRYLRKSSVMLEGEIVKAEYVKQKLRYGHGFVLTITTEFETPVGRTLTRTFRGDIVYSNTKTRTVPEVGTRVMLLYANDRAVIML